MSKNTSRLVCAYCMDPDTVETDELVPSGLNFKVLCSQGHVTNGIPTETLVRGEAVRRHSGQRRSYPKGAAVSTVNGPAGTRQPVSAEDLAVFKRLSTGQRNAVAVHALRLYDGKRPLSECWAEAVAAVR